MRLGADIGAPPADRPLAIKLVSFASSVFRKPSTWSWFLIAIAATLLFLRHQFVTDPLSRDESPQTDDTLWWCRLAAWIVLIGLEKLSIVTAIELHDWWNGEPWGKRSAALMGLQILVEVPCYVVPPWLTDDSWWSTLLDLLFEKKFAVILVDFCAVMWSKRQARIHQ